MARSRKRPWICDRNPWAKNYANRVLRRHKLRHDLADGNAYRKFTDPWTICDWKWLATPPVPAWQSYRYSFDPEFAEQWERRSWKEYYKAFRK
jgi:hypothetical protein